MNYFARSTVVVALAVIAAPAAMAGSLDDPATDSVIATAAPISAPAVAWGGHYGGVFLGYGDGSYQQGVSAVGDLGPDVGVDGTVGGLRYGHNWQNSNQVFGVDISFSSGVSGSVAQGTSSAPDWNCTTGDCTVSVDSLLTARGRYGVAFNGGQTLGYGAAGLAVGKIEGGIKNSGQFGSSTATGYTVGLGLEHMVSDRFSLYGEINYVDLGTIEFGDVVGGNAYDGVGDFSTLLFGVNYHF